MNEHRNYVFQYFQYHASQRMATFNFYVLVMGALIAGVISAEKDFPGYSVLFFGFAMMFFSVIFYMLDRRARQLVKVSELCLIEIEGKAGSDEAKIFDKEKNTPIDSRALKYSSAFASVFMFFFVVGLLSSLLGGYEANLFHKIKLNVCSKDFKPAPALGFSSASSIDLKESPASKSVHSKDEK